MREGCPKPVTSDTFAPPEPFGHPLGGWRSEAAFEMGILSDSDGLGLPPSPANSSHPLGASSSSANFPPPAGKWGVPARSYTPSHLCWPWNGASFSLIVSGLLRPEPPPACSPPRSPWSFCLPCPQTTTTSCHRRSVYRPFLTRLVIPELLTRLVDSSAQSGSLPPLVFSICSFVRLLRLLLFKVGFVDFAE